MKYLLDTNVVSEWVRPHPNVGLTAWLAAADEDELYLSVVTIAELRRGAERLPTGRRRKAIEAWLHRDILLRFERRTLPIDVAMAQAWGRVTARCEDIGRPIGSMDAFIAAAAELYDLTLVTRNDTDFRPVIKAVLNPWT